jgi:hypothetical protein
MRSLLIDSVFDRSNDWRSQAQAGCFSPVPGKMLTVAGNACPVGVDHRGIAEDHFNQVSSLTDGDSLPVFVSLELREREPIRHLQSVLVLRGHGHAAHQDGEHYCNDHHQPGCNSRHGSFLSRDL